MLDFNKKDYKKFLYYILILAILIPLYCSKNRKIVLLKQLDNDCKINMLKEL